MTRSWHRRIEYVAGAVMTAYVEMTSGSFIARGHAGYVVKATYSEELGRGTVECTSRMRLAAA